MKSDKRLYSACGAIDFATGIIMTVVALFAIGHFNASYSKLGLIGFTNGVVYMMVVMFSGRLGRFGNYRVLAIIGSLLYGLSAILFPFTRSVAQIMFLAGFGGLATGFFWPQVEAWLAQGKTRDYTRKAFAVFNIVWTSSVAIGSFSGPLLYSYNYWIAFGLAFLAALATAVLLYKLPIPAEIILAGSEGERPEDTFKYQHVAWLVNLTMFFTLMAVRTILPRMSVDLGLPAWKLSLLFLALGTGQVALFIMMGRLGGWVYSRAYLAAILGIAGIALMFLFISNSFLILVAGLILVGVASAMSYYCSLFYSLYGSRDKSHKSGIHETFTAGGILLGPLAGGFIADAFNPHAPYLFCMALIVVVAVTAQVIFRRKTS